MTLHVPARGSMPLCTATRRWSTVATPHWVARIESKTYDKVVFQNGYGRHLPTAELEYLGYDRHVGADGMRYYRLRLGRVLRVANYSVRGGGGRRPRAGGRGRVRGEHVDLNQCLDPCARRTACNFAKKRAWVPRPLPPPRLELELEVISRRGAATPAPPCISPCARRGASPWAGAHPAAPAAG